MHKTEPLRESRIAKRYARYLLLGRFRLSERLVVNGQSRLRQRGKMHGVTKLGQAELAIPTKKQCKRFG